MRPSTEAVDVAGLETVLSVPLAAAPGSARDARRLLRETVGARVPAEALHTLLLLVTELVSNAAVCSPTPCHLRVALGAQGVARVDLADGNTDLPQRADLGPEAQSGRGLLLLDALADAWGATRGRQGKVVWFTLQT